MKASADKFPLPRRVSQIFGDFRHGLKSGAATSLGESFFNQMLLVCALAMLIGVPFFFANKIGTSVIIGFLAANSFFARHQSRTGNPVRAMHMFVIGFSLIVFPLMALSAHLASSTMLVLSVVPIYGAICGMRSAIILAATYLGATLVVQFLLAQGVSIPKVFPSPPAAEITVAFIALAGMMLPLTTMIRELNASVARGRAVELMAQQAREAAEAADRAKTEFLANMSHEVATPLNGILGMATLMGHAELSTDAREQLQYLTSSAKDLQRMLDRLLDFATIEAGRANLKTIPFVLGEVVTGCIQRQLPAALAKGLTLDSQVEDGLPAAFVGDGRRLAQILDELIDNAIRFSADGKVRLEVSSSRDAQRQLTFRVRDEGLAIPIAHYSKIFTAFAQGDGSFTRQVGGMGLGLPICRRLAELMGGTLTLEKTTTGNCFALRLPLAEFA